MSQLTTFSDEDYLPTESMIETVVHAFYGKVRNDDLLAPIFGPRLDGRWDDHLATMVDFWSSILLVSGRYRGQPLTIHGRLGKITPEMWSRWLALFAETAREHCPEPVAQMFIERSQQIAAHLSKQLARAS